MFLEEWLIFFPARYPEGDWQPAGLEFEDARFEAADGTRLHGWFVPHPEPRAVVLFSHGNAGNLSHRAELLRDLRNRVGVAVMIYDYRGYGRSEGRPDEQGVLADGRAARAWLAERTGLAENELVLMGRSLGGAVAVDLAADGGARGLILESTFSSLPEAAAYHVPLLPVGRLMRTRLDSAAKIGNYHGPLFQSHGDADTVVPYRLGRRLFEKANQPKQFITLPGADHNDYPPPAYFDKLRAFVEGLD
jgi:fermentation-respiration switch protein FrsA (DUF1100 family)